MKTIRACGIVTNQNEILLLWRKVNSEEYFVFPGGKKEENETLEQTVVREVLEETSIVVKVKEYFYKVITESIETYFYTCSYISGEPKLGSGNEKFESTELNQYSPIWKNVSELNTLDIRPKELKEYFLEKF